MKNPVKYNKKISLIPFYIILNTNSKLQSQLMNIKSLMSTGKTVNAISVSDCLVILVIVNCGPCLIGLGKDPLLLCLGNQL